MSSHAMEVDELPEMTQSPSTPSTGHAESIVDEEDLMEKDDVVPISVFDQITSELLKIGAIPLERFATEDNPIELVPSNSTTSQFEKVVEENGMQLDEDGNLKGKKKEHFQALAKIYEACKKTFESTEAIEFHYRDDAGPDAIECILTLTRPDGRKRSYTSGPHYSKRTDAKAQAASIAVSMNAIDFIKYGDIDPKARATAVVESLDAPGRLKIEDGKGVSFADRTEITTDDGNVKAISDCCIEWRAGTVKPIYLHFSEPTIIARFHGKKGKNAPPPTEEELLALKQGCALKIEISQHTMRFYSVHHIYKTRVEAKAAVAALAIKQGVLDFIKHANGQTAPLKIIHELEGNAEENLNRDIINKTNQPVKEVTLEATAVNVTLKKHQIPLDAMTLHAFTNSLPKPFPETPGLKPVGEGNPVGWLNAAAQSARGSRMSLNWTYLSNAKSSLHGCLLRFDLPKIDEGRSYLVEPQFTKRSDAKSAVSLLAISQNVGGWIHEITTAIENLISPDMKAKAGSLIGPLYQECTKAKLLGQPIYTYTHEDGAVGCTLRIEFTPDLWCEYKVPVQYRMKPDSRFAVVLQAHHEGVLEFIRFRGQQPPPGYNPELPFDWKMAKKIEQAKERGKAIPSHTTTEQEDLGFAFLRDRSRPRVEDGLGHSGSQRPYPGRASSSTTGGLGYPSRRYSENSGTQSDTRNYPRHTANSSFGMPAPSSAPNIARGFAPIHAPSNGPPGSMRNGFSMYGSEYMQGERPHPPIQPSAPSSAHYTSNNIAPPIHHRNSSYPPLDYNVYPPQPAAPYPNPPAIPYGRPGYNQPPFSAPAVNRHFDYTQNYPETFPPNPYQYPPREVDPGRHHNPPNDIDDYERGRPTRSFSGSRLEGGSFAGRYSNFERGPRPLNQHSYDSGRRRITEQEQALDSNLARHNEPRKQASRTDINPSATHSQHLDGVRQGSSRQTSTAETVDRSARKRPREESPPATRSVHVDENAR